MATISFKKENKEGDGDKVEKESTPTQGCGCCKRCKVNQRGIIPVRPSLNVINIDPIYVHTVVWTAAFLFV